MKSGPADGEVRDGKDGFGWVRWLFGRADGLRGHLVARWVFLRGMGLIYFSAFFALLFQIKGLIGPTGILPAGTYLTQVRSLGALRFWYAPTVLWLGSGDRALMALCWVGLAASVLLVLNVWPRLMLVVCWVCFLGFVSAAQEFSNYQSDGMLLEAGFLSWFVAPRGVWPGWGRGSLPVRAAWFLLLWEWFRIYFQSGVVKLVSGDPTWRNLTAMYEYYQNGPLPTWVGWYLEQMPHWAARATAGLTLGMELALVWMAFLPGRWRVACFWMVTVWQVVVIATANYAFLNYLVLLMGVLLLSDRWLARGVPGRWRSGLVEGAAVRGGGVWEWIAVGLRGVLLTWVGYVTCLAVVQMWGAGAALPQGPVAALEPFRIANGYGLFATMTPHRYEIEFQGSDDGVHWTAYPFRYKPQDVRTRPGIYAPYQPRFDWNLWFASLGSWEQDPMVVNTEVRLLQGDKDVLGLFAGDPFGGTAPRYVRAVLWQYWFSTPEEKRTDGVWWRRQLLGTFAPTLVRMGDGRFGEVAAPELEAGAPGS